MTRMSYKLWKSGYCKKERKEILLSGLRGFKRLEELDKKGIRSLNRSRREDFRRRQVKKFNAKTNWYKQDRKMHEENTNPELRKRSTWEKKKGK